MPSAGVARRVKLPSRLLLLQACQLQRSSTSCGHGA
jgi:hypothetical protein